MRAFTHTIKTRSECLEQVRGHRRRDQIAQKVYFERCNDSIRACLIGCLVHGSDHALLESLYGIPQSVGRIADGIFEGIPFDLAVDLPVRFVEAIPEGADLSRVTRRFLLWILEDPEGMRRFADEATLQGMEKTSELYRRSLDGDEPDVADWREAAAWSARSARSAAESAESARSAAESAESARSAAWSAASARSAAWSAASAAESAAESAAWSAAESAASAASAAESAAWSAAWSAAEVAAGAAARSAARSAASAAAAAEEAEEAARIRQCEKLLALIRDASMSIRDLEGDDVA